MASNSALVVSDLDFDTIRSNLSTYLKSQVQFKDYDFDGSNLGVLLDILSYNTYMNNFYTNMAISESFLDSAQVRDSVVSRAKELNYTPRSYRSAIAYVNITIKPNDSPSTITIPKGTVFNSRIDNSVYTFTTNAPYIVTSAGNYQASNVALYEGIYVTETFLVDSNIENQKFVLNSTSVDTSSISITVKNSSSDITSTEFIQATSLLGYNSTSKIFFIQASDKNRYEIIFGDGTIGTSPINGNVVTVSYRISKGSIPNGASSFIPVSSVAGYPTSLIQITTVQAAYSGAEPETITSIKFNAPRHYQTQDRAITLDDYRTILLAEYPDIRAINVYGGESVYPPQYGSVFISVDLNSYVGVPDILKNSIKAFIISKMPISIEPIIISADYTYVDLIATVSYNINVSAKNENEIKNNIIDAIQAFNLQYLDDYNKIVRYSKLASTIDTADSSIVTSNLVIRMIKKISPTIGSDSQVFRLDYQNSVQANSLISSSFTYGGIVSYLKDTGNNEIAIVTTQTDLTSSTGISEIVLKHNVGTIDYTSGIASINIPTLDDYTGDSIKIYASSVVNDFLVKNNTVVLIDNADINITAQAIRV